MKDSPLFSVVIPLYNKERHIERAVSSVLKQTYPSFELILVDDGSTDGSVDAVGSFLDKINLIQQENQGESAARNTGIRNARYEYVAFLDADDEWTPDFLANIAEMIKIKPGYMIYCTNYIKKMHAHSQLAIPPREREIAEIDYFDIARSGSTPISSSSVCIHKHLFESIGMFPIKVRLYADLYLWTKAALEFPVCFHSAPLAIYHRDADNRVCNEIVRTESDTPFEPLIKTAQDSGNLQGRKLRNAKEFLCHYKLLNAFKAMTQYNTEEAKRILQATQPVSAKQITKKWVLTIASMLPDRALNTIWRLFMRKKPR